MAFVVHVSYTGADRPFVGRILCVGWRRMVELLECAVDVAEHGDVDIVFVVVPV